MSTIKDLMTLEEKSNDSYEEIERSLTLPMQIVPENPSVRNTINYENKFGSMSPQM